MSKGEYHNASLVRAVHERERKLLHEYAASICWRWRARARKGDCARNCLLYSRYKAHTELRLNGSVVGNLKKKLAPRWRDESRRRHRINRRASANTSSAGYECNSPRSKAATRFSISADHAASISATGVCRDSRIDWASLARSSGLNARTCSSICSSEGDISGLSIACRGQTLRPHP